MPSSPYFPLSRGRYVPDDTSLLPPLPSATTDPSDPLAQRPPLLQTALADEQAIGGRVWHLDAGRFARPRASIITLLRTPELSDGSPERGVLSQIGAELMCDQLTTALAPCGFAGLGWSVSAYSGGLLVQVSGCSRYLYLDL